MNFLLFLAPFSWGTQKREAAAPKASGCFMGGTCTVRGEPRKQKPRSCRAQELARSRAQENERQIKGGLLDSARFPTETIMLATTAGNGSKVRCHRSALKTGGRESCCEWPAIVSAV